LVSLPYISDSRVLALAQTAPTEVNSPLVKEIGCGGPVPIVKRITLALRPVVLFFAALLAAFLAMTGPLSGAPQEQEHVKPIPPPVTPLPPEAQSRDVARFSFIAYGDTRGRRDGVAIQYEHSLGKKRRLPATEVSSVSLLASSLPQLVEITRNEGRMVFPRGGATPMWSC